MRKFLLTLLGWLVFYSFSFAQCGPVIASFPYNEGFEAGPAGWNSGGTSSDWAWGTPSKAYIQTAGGGTKCWVTGSLNGSFYNYGQRSYVTSPCFNFTGLQNPHVKMKIYWEGENQYDGTVFQYSLNNGATWINVGTNIDPVDCLNANWFNQGNINALSSLATPRHGWAGTVLPTSGGCFGGGGSAGWVLAQHCMPYLAGQPNVQFRFAFGAGTVCNDFDGFAFDDFTLEEAPGNNADFSFGCSSTPLAYQFTQTSALCPNTFTWSFGDPGSGPNNSSNSPNPAHVFSSPGTYVVTLSVSGPCNQSSSISKVVTTLSGSGSFSSPLCYNASTGSISYSCSGGTGGMNYTLQPMALSNGSGLFNNLPANTYTVVATDASGCSLTNVYTLTNPAALNWTSFTTNPVTCYGTQNGQIQAQVNGGTGNLSYTLQAGNLTNSSGNFSPLAPGNYTVTVSDANACTLSSVTQVIQPLPLVWQNVTATDIACFGGQSGSISVSTSGGNGGNLFTLFPGSSTNGNGQFQSLSSGTYTVLVTDAKNCSMSTVITLSQAPELVFTGLTTTAPSCVPGNDGTMSITASGGSGTLLYSIGGMYSTANTYGNLPANTYTVTVKDANNCSRTTTLLLQNPNAPAFTQSSQTDVLCFGQSNGSIVVNASGSHAIQSYWLQPDNSTSLNGQFSGLSAGTYTITVLDAEGCTNTTVLSVLAPQALLIENISFLPQPCQSNFLGTLQAIAEGGTGGYSFELKPTGQSNTSGLFDISRSGDLLLRVSDQHGCIAEQTITIPERICCEQILIPSAFSPNGDGKNDEFRILNASGIDLKKMTVFNRWGQIVFDAQHIEDRWDGLIKGSPAEIGTYFYLVQYTCLSTGKMYVLKGDLTLIR